MSRFDSRTFYDAPEEIVSMLLDGELTAASTKNALFNPAALSLEERTGLSDRLKAAAGNTRLTDALVDVATNPLVWFYLVTTPVGATALRRGSSLVGSMGKRYNALLKEGGTLGLGLRTAGQAVESPSVHAVMAQVGARNQQLERQFHDTLHRELQTVLEKHGLEHLDWQTIYDPKKREKAREIAATLQLRMTGADRDVQELIVKTEEGFVRKELATLPRLVASNVEARSRALGLEPLVDASRKFLDSRAMMLAERDRLPRVLNAMRSRSVTGGISGDLTTAQGAELVKLVVGPAVEATALDKLNRAELQSLIDEVVLSPIAANGRTYYPRNVMEVYEKGRATTQDAWSMGRVVPSTGSRVTGSLFNRSRATAMYHPDDLRFIKEKFGGTKALDDAIAEADSILEKSNKGPQAFLRMNWERGLAKYEDSTRRTLTLTDLPGPEVLAANARVRREFKGQLDLNSDLKQTESLNHYGYTSVGNKEVNEKLGLDIREPIEDAIAAGRTPIGGFSVVDALESDWKLMRSGLPQRVVSDIIAPRMMGIGNNRSMLGMSALLQAKETAVNFANSTIGKSIEGMGDYGKKFVDGLRLWGTEATTVGQATGFSRGVARLLYVSHLGLNVSSAILNSMQPFIMGPSVLGGAAVAEGWGKAVKEVFDFTKARVNRYGFRAITNAERDDLIRKHFKYAAAPGIMGGTDDLLGITSNTRQLLGDALGKTPMGAFGKETKLNRVAFELPMFMFTQAELLNRSATAHAVEAAYRRAGRAVNTPEFAGDVRRFVQEMQFGSQPLNTPVAMQGVGRAADIPLTGRLLANPLTRQFLSFQTRSFTSPWHFTAKLGGGKREILGQEVDLGRLGSAAFDAGRALGFSALVYEVGKNLLHTDLSRGLAYAAMTDLVPGMAQGRYDSREGPLPLPPAVDIPWEMATSFAQGDGDLFRRQVVRLIPGGIGLSRAATGLPELPVVGGLIQEQYADWNAMGYDEEGRAQVPIYDRDGSLLEWRPAMRTVLRAAGADLADEQVREIEASMLRNREEAVAMKREAVRALIGGNDMGAFQRIKAQYEKKFGVPMQISRAHLDSASRMVETTRTMRVFETLPQELKDQYQRFVPHNPATMRQGGAAGVDAEAAVQQYVRESMGAGVRPRSGVFDPFAM